jgi:hypothetical protein
MNASRWHKGRSKSPESDLLDRGVAAFSTWSRSWKTGVLVCAAFFGVAMTAGADDRPVGSQKAKDAAASPAISGVGGTQPTSTVQPGNINEAEASLSRRYRQFERILLQMAEYLRKTEPERADLLIRAIGKSKEDRVGLQMDQILELLKNDQLGDAIGQQEHLVANLKGLLELLQSEDRRHQLDEEKKWIELLHKEVGKLSVREKELRRLTEGGGKLGPLSERQSKIGRDAKSLVEKIDKQDATRNASNGKNSSNQSGKPPDSREPKESSDQQNPDGRPEPKENGEKPEGKQKSEGKSGDQSAKKKSEDKEGSKNEGSKKEDSKQEKSKGGAKRPAQGSGSKGKSDGSQESPPSDQSESESPPQQMERKTPGREEIEQARRAMQQAEEELKRLQGDKALERQDEAIRKLAEAKERLEKILRQLREEEQEIMLTSLEARFAKMLLMEIQIHVDTTTLGKTGKNAWTARHFGKARELSVQQESVGVEAIKALTLLKEEGSSVAFPKGVEQVHDDMLTIASRLGKNDVGELTQSIEKDVIESLEELVAALQSEIENRKKPEAQRQRGQRPRNGEPPDKQLVEQIAELKMLRSLQMRVNRRTKQIGRLIRGEQATSDDLAAQLQTLARRQAEIQEATYILASGRNQ